MWFSSRPGQLLTVFIAFSTCWAAPTDSPPKTPSVPSAPVTPPKQPMILPIRPGGSSSQSNPSTPNQPNRNPPTPGAPKQGGAAKSLEIDDIITEWMSRKEDMMKGFPYSKGGLELWVQYELEYLFKTKYYIPIDKQIAFREENVYSAGGLADFVFTPDMQQSSQRTKGLILEIKVESSTSKGAAFAKRVKADQDKIKLPLRSKYEGYDKRIAVIAWSAETHAALEPLGLVAFDRVKINAGQNKVIRLYVE